MLVMWCIVGCFFFTQKTAYEMRISDWSSDVCSSDLSDRSDAPLCEPPRRVASGACRSASTPCRYQGQVRNTIAYVLELFLFSHSLAFFFLAQIGRAHV